MRKLMVMAWMMAAATCFAQQLDFKSLDKFAAKAKNKTEINMDESMVQSASGLLNQKKGDEALAKKSAKDLKGFFLRVYEFDEKGAYRLEDLKPILDQLKGPNWVSLLRNQEDGEQTEIWMHRTDGQADGMLLVSAEKKEIVVINAMGVTRLEDLMNLADLDLPAVEDSKKSPAKPEEKKD